MIQTTEAELPSVSATEDPALSESSTGERTLTLGQAVGRVAGFLASDVLSNGDRAALRRISPQGPFTPALWNVLFRLEKDGFPVGLEHVTLELRWATLLSGMARCISPSLNLHDYAIPLGKALAEAGWSELRFVQLLRARDEKLDVFVRQIAMYLSSKSKAADWSDVARLLLVQSGDQAESVRLHVARSYYRALYDLNK